MSDEDKTKSVPRPVLDAQMLVELSSFTSAGKPEDMIASLVGAIVLIADRTDHPDQAIEGARDGLRYARSLLARKASGVPS